MYWGFLTGLFVAFAIVVISLFPSDENWYCAVGTEVKTCFLTRERLDSYIDKGWHVYWDKTAER